MKYPTNSRSGYLCWYCDWLAGRLCAYYSCHGNHDHQAIRHDDSTDRDGSGRGYKYNYDHPVRQRHGAANVHAAHPLFVFVSRSEHDHGND